MSPDSTTLERLDKMLDTINKRKDQYKKVLIGLSFEKQNDDTLKPCYIFFEYLFDINENDKNEVLSYDNFIIIKRYISVENSIDIINSIFRNKIIQLVEFENININIETTIQTEINVYSASQYGYKKCDWPYSYFSADYISQSQGRIPRDLKTNLDFPIYPNGEEALLDILKLDLPEGWSVVTNRLEILIPDYRARINRMILAGSKVKIDVENLSLKTEEIVTKFFCRTESKILTSGNIPLTDNSSSFSIDENPIKVEVQIFDSIKNEMIDKRLFDYQYPGSYSGVIFEDQEMQILEMIDKGETIRTEFKSSLNPTTSSDFTQTVVAFANRYGGTIFIGVDDEGKLKNYPIDEKDKIIDWISDYCTPRIEPIIQTMFRVKDNVITIVRIPEGQNKPYIHREKGILIRAGGTDRQIKLDELDEIYQEKLSSDVTFYRARA